MPSLVMLFFRRCNYFKVFQVLLAKAFTPKLPNVLKLRFMIYIFFQTPAANTVPAFASR